MELPETIVKRKAFCNNKLSKVTEKVIDIKEIKYHDKYCIYVTGSYARLEASTKSDLDLFFVQDKSGKVPNIDKTLIDAGLILLQRDLELPEFSRDGEYLQIHTAQDIVDELGSKHDDYENYFTARMLLMTESKPIYNEEYYLKVLNIIISPYFRDFHDHEKNFKPYFLVNDIIRFWKTLCLNYEHRRHRDDDGNLTEEQKDLKKLKAYTNNLKLRFSRKMTCFSFLLLIMENFRDINVEKVIEIVQLSPIERMQALGNRNEKLKPLIDKAILLYVDFLNLTEKPNDYLADKKNRNIEFERGRLFGDCMYKILEELSDRNGDNIFKYLVS